MKRKLSGIIFIIVIAIIIALSIVNADNTKAIANLVIETQKGENIKYLIYRSPYIDDKTQIENTIKYIYENQPNVLKILLVNNDPIEQTEYAQYGGRIAIKNNTVKTTTINSEKEIKDDIHAISTNTDLKYRIYFNGKEDYAKIKSINGKPLITEEYINKILKFECIKKSIKDDLKIITFKNEEKIINLKVSDNRLYINDKLYYLDNNVIMENNTIYIPVKLLEYFCDINIDYEKNIINISI